MLQKKARRLIRLGAKIVDNLLIAAPLIAFGIVDAIDQTRPETQGTISAIGLLIALGAVLILAGVQAYLLTTRGQTIGKILFKIRIVRAQSGELPGFARAVLLRSWVNGVFGSAPCVGGFYTLTDALFIFGEERRCVHDFLADTIVVELGFGVDPDIFA